MRERTTDATEDGYNRRVCLSWIIYRTSENPPSPA